MNEKTEALRLAELLAVKAAAELRRQHEEIAELREANETFGKRQEWWNERMFVLEAQRDALLGALRKHVYLHDKDCVCEDCAAIKPAEENT